MTDEIRILVVDDMALYRKVLSDVVGQIPGATVVGTAFDGRAALDRVERLRPDLVLLDVEMPNLNGLETLRAIRERWPDVGVVMVSGTNKNAADITIQALEDGAIDFVPKPVTRGPAESRQALLDALGPIVRTFRMRSTLRRARTDGPTPTARTPRFGADGGPAARRPSLPGARGAQPSGPVTLRPTGAGPGAALQLAEGRPATPGEFGVLAIGVSTGGPQALSTLIPALAPTISVPVVVVQHMPPGFTASLAGQLDRKSALAVSEGAEGDILEPGRVLIAPGGRHMTIRKRGTSLVVGLTDAPPVKSCRPSVDVLFRSLVGSASRRVLTLIMTGMGDDGADGVQALLRQGSYNVTQDEASCVVWGMPRAIAERRLAHEILPLPRIATRINELVSMTRAAPAGRAPYEAERRRVLA